MKHWVVKITLYISLFFICIYSLIWSLTPTVTRIYSNELLNLALQENDLVLSEESSIRYNPFLSHLTISDLVITKGDANGKKVLAIKDLSLELSLYKLVINHFQISEFEIDGLFVDVVIEGDEIEIAGVPLSSLAKKDKSSQHTQELKQETTAIILKMAQLGLYDTDIKIMHDQTEHHFEINKLVIARVHASTKDQSIGLQLEAALNEAPITVSLSAKMFKGEGEITSYATLSDLELSQYAAYLPPEIISLSGLVNLKSEQTIALSKAATDITVKQFAFSTKALALAYDDYLINLEEQTLSSDKITANLSKDKAPVITADAAYELHKLTASVLSEEQVLAKLNIANISNIHVSAKDYTHQINVDKISLDQATFSDDTTNDTLPLAQFNNFSVNNISASEQGLAISQITLSGVSVDARLDQEKNLLNLIKLPESKTTEGEALISEDAPELADATQPTETSAHKPSDFSLQVDEFVMTDNAHIDFVDYSITPEFKRHFIISTLKAGPVNNQDLTQKTLFELVGKSEEYSFFNFAGYSLPFAEQPIHHVKGDFKEISLPEVSPYMKDALQYVFDSGQLDLHLDTTITGEDIDGHLGILMRGLELTSADDEVDSISDKTAIPFSVALGMLKDRDGNVELDVPLSGKTSDPSVGLSGFVTLLIKQATMSAAQDYLLTTFVPYANVVSFAMTAGDFMLKIRFSDLEYPATKSELQPEHNVFLDQFAALLKDRADENITLCAISTAADIGKSPGADISSAEDIKRLKALSLARMNTFKNHMVNTQGLKSSRLLLCKPQVDSDEDAKPRMTFTN